MPNIIRALARSAVGFPTAVDIEAQDVGSGPGRAAYVKLGATNPNSLPATALVGTDSLTAVSAEQTDSNGWRWRLYAAMLTVEGVQTIRGTWSDGNNAKIMGGCVVSGVDPGNIIAGLQWANNNVTISQPRWAVPSAVGGLVIALFATDEFNTNTPSSPAAALTGTGLGSGVLFHAMQQAGAAGDVDIDSTLGTVPAVWRGFAFNVPGSGGAAPVITGPAGASVTAPSAANFSATVSGIFTGLRWQRQAGGTGGWSDVVGGTGGTTSSYTTGATSVTGGSFNNGDRFRLAVDWSGGTVFSNDVLLTVSAAGVAPSITSQPTSQSVTIPSAATFAVTATGSGTLSYQWQRQPAGGGGFTNISGANSASYTTPATAISGGAANSGDQYRCVVTGDTSPPATSNAATLTVLPPLATTVSVTLTTDGTTPAASLTGLKWAFYDQATPDLFTTAPVARGAAGSTNGAGLFSASITGTARRQGEIGCLLVTNSDGTVTQGAAQRGFFGPVTVS